MASQSTTKTSRTSGHAHNRWATEINKKNKNVFIFFPVTLSATKIYAELGRSTDFQTLPVFAPNQHKESRHVSTESGAEQRHAPTQQLRLVSRCFQHVGEYCFWPLITSDMKSATQIITFQGQWGANNAPRSTARMLADRHNNIPMRAIARIRTMGAHQETLPLCYIPVGDTGLSQHAGTRRDNRCGRSGWGRLQDKATPSTATCLFKTRSAWSPDAFARPRKIDTSNIGGLLRRWKRKIDCLNPGWRKMIHCVSCSARNPPAKNNANRRTTITKTQVNCNTFETDCGWTSDTLRQIFCIFYFLKSQTF